MRHDWIPDSTAGRNEMPEWDTSASSLTPYQHPFIDNSPLALRHSAITGTHFNGHPLLWEPIAGSLVWIGYCGQRWGSRNRELFLFFSPASPDFVAFDCEILAKQVSLQAG